MHSVLVFKLYSARLSECKPSLTVSRLLPSYRISGIVYRTRKHERAIPIPGFIRTTAVVTIYAIRISKDSILYTAMTINHASWRFFVGARDSHLDVLVKDCSISSADALEILQSCTRPSICFCQVTHIPSGYFTLAASMMICHPRAISPHKLPRWDQ